MIISAAGILMLVYIFLMLCFIRGWKKMPLQRPATVPELPFITLLIAVRNEEKNISHLLDDLVMQDYPAGKFELIVSDDHSADATRSVVQRYTNRFSRLVITSAGAEFGKKAALDAGLQQATGHLIVAADADIRVGRFWLRSIASATRPAEHQLIILPVFTCPGNSLLGRFQFLEFLSLAAVAGGSAAIGNPILCNGAAMAFTKSAYSHFMPKKPYASGDDIFFLLNLKKEKKNAIHYLKSNDAIAYTQPAAHLKTFFMQRIRWLSKSGGYTDPMILFTALIILAGNLSVWIPLTVPQGWKYTLGLFALKISTDYLLIQPVARFTRYPGAMKYYLPCAMMYPVYALLLGLSTLFIHPEWKGRRIS